MPRGQGTGDYSKEFKINAVELYFANNKALERTADELGIKKETFKNWVYSDWGKLRLAELAIQKNNKIVSEGLQTIANAKVEHLTSQFKFFTELEEMMSECIDRYRTLIPNSTKLSDVNDAFKVISDAYIKALSMINKEPGEDNKKDDVENYIVNIIDKQLVARPESIQELLSGKR